MIDKKELEEVIKGGAGGANGGNTPEEDYEHIRESVEQNIPVIHLGGPPRQR